MDWFRVQNGAERPGTACFRSGLGLNEQRFRARPDFEPGHFVPAGTEAIPGHFCLTERDLAGSKPVGWTVNGLNQCGKSCRGGHLETGGCEDEEDKVSR